MRSLLRAPQSLWVTLTVAALAGVMSLVSEPFASADNIFNISRNFAFIGLIALGQTAVIATGGIDLSVGSVMGLAGIVTGLVLGSGQPLIVAAAAGLGCALLCGLVNGSLVAYFRLSPFVVTLGMLSVARSLALVISNNRMIHDFGPDEDLLLALGGGRFPGSGESRLAACRRGALRGSVVPIQPAGAARARGRRQRGFDPAGGCARDPGEAYRLRAQFPACRGFGDPDDRLAGSGHERAGAELRTAHHRVGRDRRRQSDGAGKAARSARWPARR